MKSQREREAAIFSEARRLSPPLRAEHLSRACAGDASLRKRVEELLRHFEAAEGFMDEPAILAARPGPQPADSAASEKPGGRIGRYKLLQQIGEGGCGVVYMAEQEEPVRRLVALKVIKLGMDTKQVIARFEAERQALAMMDHPNIAKVLDAGATESGRPYFVMELVRGIRITAYCDEKRFSTEDRLLLFIQVCHAIQHAHQKGIIHRDIKPSNVLVTSRDEISVPKVIDFGIAKATTDQRLTDKTLFTAFEQFMGTPAYMSPEQAAMNEMGIDTRSDIYSLGILLYELLTGATPFDTAELMAGGLDALRQTIRLREPVRPSTRLSTMVSAQLTSLAGQRQTDAPRLIHLIRGDLDWIVMKALEKDRARRYETANGLALDVQRFLDNEPVLARPPSNFYLLQKLVNRNKLAFAAAAAVVAALMAGLGLSTYLLVREKAASRRAIKAETSSRMAAAQSEQIAKFLERMIEAAGPEAALGRDTQMMREILDKTEKEMGTELKGQPEVQARLTMTIAGVYDQLNDFSKTEALCRHAIDLRRGAVGDEDATIGQWLDHLGSVQMQRGDFAGAEVSLRQALELERKLFPGGGFPVANVLTDLGSLQAKWGNPVEAASTLRAALEPLKTLPASEDKSALEGHVLNELGLVLWRQGNLEEAEESFHRAISLGKLAGTQNTPESLTSLGNLGLLLWERGKLEEAEEDQRQTLAMKIKVLGTETNTQIAGTLHNLALVLRDEGKLAEAEGCSRRALVIETRLVGENHPDVATARKALATILRRRGESENNPGLLEEALALNPADFRTADALTVMLGRKAVASSDAQQTSWRYSIADPGPEWASPEFADHAWLVDPPARGTPNCLPRSEHAVTPTTNIWLRRSFDLKTLPASPVVFLVSGDHDAQIFINGAKAANVGWSDAGQYAPCFAAAQSKLRVGRNVLAMKCSDADNNARIAADMMSDEGQADGQRQVMELYDGWLAKNPQRAELHVGRADALARRGRWREAAADVKEALKLDSSDSIQWFRLTLLLVETEPDEIYAQQRESALERFSDSSDPTAAARISIAALLKPASGAVLEKAGNLADAAAKGEYRDSTLPLRQLAKALADLRRGRFAESQQWARKAMANAASRAVPAWTCEREDDLGALARSVEAMALCNSNAFAEAAAALNAGGVSELSEEDRKRLGSDWAERIIGDILFRQAKALCLPENSARPSEKQSLR